MTLPENTWDQRNQSPVPDVGPMAGGSEAPRASRERRPPSGAPRSQGTQHPAPAHRWQPGARLTQGLDGVLRGLLLLGTAAGHERGDGEGVGAGGELGFGRRRELHGLRCAVLAGHGACRAAVQLSPSETKAETQRKVSEGSHGAAGDPGGASPNLLRAPRRPRFSLPPQSPRAAEAPNWPETAGEDQPQAQPGAPRGHSLRRWTLVTSISCAKAGGPTAPAPRPSSRPPVGTAQAAGCGAPAARR